MTDQPATASLRPQAEALRDRLTAAEEDGDLNWFATPEALGGLAALQQEITRADSVTLADSLVLGTAYLCRFHASGGADDWTLGGAVSFLWLVYTRAPDQVPGSAAELLAALGPGPAFDPPTAYRVASGLIAFFLRVRYPGVLDSAESLLRRAADAVGDDDPVRGSCQSSLGMTLWLAAITSSRPDRWEALLEGIGLAEYSRDEAIGDEAIGLAEAEVPPRARAGKPAEEQALLLAALGLLRWRKAAATRDNALRQAAIEALREALACCPPGGDKHGLILSSLALVLHDAGEATGDQVLLDEAVGRTLRAAALGPGAGTHARLHLASVQQTLAMARADPQLSEGAAETLEAGLEDLGENHPLRVRFLTSLAVIYSTRVLFADNSLLPLTGERDRVSAGESALLRWAADAAREAVDAAPGTGPDRAMTQELLAGIQLRRARAGQPVSLPETAELAGAVAGSPAAPPLVRARAARARGEALAAMSMTGDAVSAYAQAVDLLTRAEPRGLARAAAEGQPGSVAGLANDAAAIALEAGAPEKALALLERGRGILLDSEPGARGGPRPPDGGELYAAAAGGPVVVVNVSRHRCDAILVTTRDIDVVRLPRLTPPAVRDRVLAAAPLVHEASGHGVHDGGPDLAAAAAEALSQDLGWLWDTIAAPVLDRLGLCRAAGEDESWPRIFWCPTGWLSFLPLHAAGHHREDTGRSVLDRAISSYTPTVRALTRARSQLTRPLPGQTMSRPPIVALPQASGPRAVPDDAARMASSFQLAGYPHVIGALWPVPDRLSSEIRKEFYDVLAGAVTAGRALDPAAALHDTARGLRGRLASAPHLWAAYTHIGP